METLQPGGGEDQGIELAGVQLPETRVEVPTHGQEARAGKDATELRTAAH